MALPIDLNPHWLASAAADYQIERSLRFNSADSSYLSRTPGSASDRRTFTWSGWVKRSNRTTTNSLFAAYVDANNFFLIHFREDADDGRFEVFNYSSAFDFRVETNALLRDPSAWYHIVVALDTTQATSSNRIKIYVNGTQQTLATTSYPTLNFQTDVNNTNAHNIGADGANARYHNGYLTEVHFIDGQALTPSSFGETDSATGVWKPKAYSGTYGTNGFYLNFSDNSGTTATTLGKDYSGNGNNWTPNNFSVTAGAGNDSLVDSPTSYGTDTGAGGEVRGNYATLNTLDNAQGATISDGNLKAVNASATDKFYRGTFGMSSGKWYWEVQLTTVGNRNRLGITDNTLDASGTTLAGDYALVSTGNQSYNTSTASTPTVPTFADNDYICFAFDADAGILYFEKNATPNTSTSPKFTGLSVSKTYFVTNQEPGATPGVNIFNFGQRAFQYTATSNYKALCTQNLPTPTIKQGDDYFNIVLYTGNGTTISNNTVGFQPDFVWIKGRSGATNHQLFDSVRGTTKVLVADLTEEETTSANTLTSFDSSGFTVGSNTALNTSTATYVAWNWKASGSNVTNNDGTITSTVRANTTSGFSIVTYTGNGTSGATVGHGLGVTPGMMIVKVRSTTNTWRVYHSSLGATKSLLLDTNDSVYTQTGAWNDTAPTSTVFSVGNFGSVNGNTDTYVAYCFAPVAGYSVFGSYTGNGSTDGPFVFCGFRPRYVLIKRTDSTGWWHIWDTARNTYNLSNLVLFPNDTNAEATYTAPDPVIDILSNGFKQRGDYPHVNASGGTYIYAAFAENPFKYALAR